MRAIASAFRSPRNAGLQDKALASRNLVTLHTRSLESGQFVSSGRGPQSTGRWFLHQWRRRGWMIFPGLVVAALVPFTTLHAAEVSPAVSPAVTAAREQLIRRATTRARAAGLTAAEREVLRDLLREAFSHILDEEMKPEEIAAESRVPVAVAESTLARARRFHLLDMTTLGAGDPLLVAEAMDVPWLRALSASDRAALRAFLAPRTPPRLLRACVSDDDQRARLAACVLARPRAFADASRESWVGRMLTRAECLALRDPATPHDSEPLRVVRAQVSSGDSLDLSAVLAANAASSRAPSRSSRKR